jgi:glycosyltransferase involved in cell wall biosynthesis
MKISYAVTVCNELEEIKRLIAFLQEHKREQDEIVVLMDNGTMNPVYQFLVEQQKEGTLKYFTGFLNNDFAAFKNKLMNKCTGDYIFQIDADEIPSEVLIVNLPQILEENDIDVIMVPRINTVEGLTDAHVAKWRWQVNEHGWVNWPDYQWRIYRRAESITWKNPVHEVLAGYKTVTQLPAVADLSLIHAKTIDRQERQNEFYDKL